MEKVSDVVDDRDYKPIPFDVFAPWANLLARIKVPDDMMEEVQKLYKHINQPNYESMGEQLVGQIEEEPMVTKEAREKFSEWETFLNDTILQFVRVQLGWNFALRNDIEEKVFNEKFYSTIKSMWFVKQKPGEYNPLHVHTHCKVSGIVYLQTPKKQLKSVKGHHDTDGKITFFNNAGTDMNFSEQSCFIKPEVGDMYIFPSLTHHMVWPYRSEDPDDLRLSLSFNADYTTQIGKEMLDRRKEITKAKINVGVMKGTFGENMIGEEK